METCLDLYKNLNIQSNGNNIEISPCCLAPTRPVNKINFLNDGYLTEIRTSWNENKFHHSCNSCKIAEDRGLISRRIGSNSWYKENNLEDSKIELIRVDYWVGDLCNLKCAICGPKNSSAWKQELNIPIEYKKTVINEVWRELDLSNIRYVHFNGGEPLLSKEHVKFLNALPNKNQIHINYNTNGTIKPTEDLLSLWSEFKIVQLDFSIDDIGERFEYQRYPASWEEVVENLAYFKNHCSVNCMFAINVSLGILNNYNHRNLKNWFQNNFAVNKVTDPVEIRTQLTYGILSLDNVNFRKNSIINYLNKLDEKRNTSWRKTFPELIKLLN